MKKSAPTPAPEAKKAAKKLSYKEQREYDLMEESILAAETRQEELEARMHELEVIADPAKLAECWEELEQLRNGDV